MNFGIGSAFSKVLGSAFSEGPGPGPLYKVCPWKVLSRKISHYANEFGLGNILGPMGSAEHPLAPIYLINCAQLRMLVMKATFIKNCEHFVKCVTSNLLQYNLKDL